MPNPPKVNVFRMPPLLSSSSTGPDFHHFSSQDVFGVFRGFLYCPCPLIIYFLKNTKSDHITSLYKPSNIFSSHSEVHPKSLFKWCLIQWGLPQMSHIIQQYLPPPIPNVYLFTYCPQSQKSPNPFILPFPLQGTFLSDNLLFVLFLFLFLNISCL